MNENKLKVLGVIPARSGSKGILNKNKKIINGKPLIEYSLEAATKSKLSKIIISSDSEEICSIGNKFNIQSILRPKELAEDSTPMLLVIQHIVDRLEYTGEIYDAVMILQPTCPLRSSNDIDGAIDIMEGSDCESVVSVYKVEDAHPARMYKMKNGLLNPYEEVHNSINRQNLPEVFHRNGSIYCTKISTLKNGSIYGNKVLPLLMGRENSINIDDQLDWEVAEYLLSKI